MGEGRAGLPAESVRMVTVGTRGARVKTHEGGEAGRVHMRQPKCGMGWETREGGVGLPA